ncbi:uncharacterized protein LOC122650905 [Telopea speciosissima]|uniref:uncharacterized protein LOC122650905 n=1 Tax=Telopea speciosissima TaxID=54955 RepID=UPI001CC7BF1D|nr:uncharacterized protein LOC122650905 [Telopea speciosissima]
MALKLDMKKAYDRLEWSFIEGILIQFGFCKKWVDMVMACITSVSYEILINGAVRGVVTPTRGIRHGDSLSLAIFVLCSQALSSVLKQAKERNLIHSIKNRVWKVELIRGVFHPVDEAEILNIQLSVFNRPDIQVWGVSKSGVYSSKSTYHLLNNLEERKRSMAAASPSHMENQIPNSTWKRIWSCNSLPKIKSFLWRACLNAIACADNPRKKCILIDPLWSRCGRALKSTNHLLLDCDFSRAVWFGSRLSFVPPSQDPQISKAIHCWGSLSPFDKVASKVIISFASFLCSNLWLSRNDLTFNGKNSSPQEVIQQAERSFLEFKEGVTKSSVQSNQSPTPAQSSTPTSWTPPAPQLVKMNVDATLNKGKGGIGLVVRNSTGIPSLAVSYPMVFSSPLRSEALAIRVGLLEGISEGLDFLMVESNCKELISLVFGSQSTTPPEVYTILQDIRELRGYFRECTFHHVSRENNSMADSLARRTISLACRISWPISTTWMSDLVT